MKSPQDFIQITVQSTNTIIPTYITNNYIKNKEGYYNRFNLYKQIQMCFLTVHENKLILILGPQYFSPILEEFLQNKEGNINVLEYYCKYA